MKVQSAICLIQDINSGFFLLLKRVKEMKQYSNLYSLAGGRFDENHDQSLIQTLVREVKEETNIDLDLGKTQHLMDGENDGWFIKCYHSLVDMEVETLKLNPDEHSEYVFVSRDEILGMLTSVPVTIECVSKYLNEVMPCE